MHTIIQGLSSVPGVVGGMLSDEQGNVLANSLPSFFDEKDLKRASSMINDNVLGLHDTTGVVKLFDIRCELGRLIIRPLPHLFVVVLCQPTVNIQLLFISLNVAIKKIQTISVDQPHVVTSVVAPTPMPVSFVPDRYRAVSDGKGVLLTCKIMKNATALFGTDSASVNKNTALEISAFYETGPFKKLTITNPANGISVRVPTSVIQYDRDGANDGKISPSTSLLETLHAKEGDQVRVEIIKGGGIFGWDGI
ncbi:MAG: roadblock/LC7 domain-containing protein [Desulfuromonadaceae bacterium]|nr:roadblock/LC7 domain-containing protein [Desulfuromonadaceae bacterium]